MEYSYLKSAREVMKSGSLDTIQLAKKKYDLLMEPVCRKWELTRRELDILLFLANNPGLDRAVDIVNIRQIAKSHVSLSVGNLEERGMLYRDFDPDDRRTAHLKLTAATEPIIAEGRQLQQQFFGRIFAGLTEEEFALWHSILDRVCVNIYAMEDSASN